MRVKFDGGYIKYIFVLKANYDPRSFDRHSNRFMKAMENKQFVENTV